MTQLARALLEIRTLRQRVEALETARPPKRKRESAPKPDTDDNRPSDA